MYALYNYTFITIIIILVFLKMWISWKIYGATIIWVRVETAKLAYLEAFNSKCTYEFSTLWQRFNANILSGKQTFYISFLLIKMVAVHCLGLWPGLCPKRCFIPYFPPQELYSSTRSFNYKLPQIRIFVRNIRVYRPIKVK